MKNTEYQNILRRKNLGQKMLSILLDPDKTNLEDVQELSKKLYATPVTHILVGGSQQDTKHPQALVKALKKHINLPVFLFPGHPQQITPEADALLFLSLLNATDAKYLIGMQTEAAPLAKASELEVISTGYILVDGGSTTTVQQVTKTSPLPQHQSEKAANLALAAEYLGIKLIYLEAGSGAKTPISSDFVKKVREKTSLPILVGGGIKKLQQIKSAYDAGADMIVIGTAFENNPLFLESLKSLFHE
ncbi:MAG: geranylgeranylglyceryl/heptaprenylglyceryl phosphate synthase [Flavobacterium sp.]